jgi:hypothetical protein
LLWKFKGLDMKTKKNLKKNEKKAEWANPKVR